MSRVVELQPALRSALKDPLGPLFTDPEALLAAAASPIITVGDMVTYHLLEAGRVPDVALIDDRTERTAVEDDVRERISGFDREVTVENPPATLTSELLEALDDAIERASGAGGDTADQTTLVVVDGEEDLAALPAVVLAPAGASVVYGQPGEGMVLVDVDSATGRARDLLGRMDGDTELLWSLLE